MTHTNTNLNDMKNHKHYQICYNAYRNFSHYPEKRAASFCEYIDACILEFTNINATEQQKEKLESLFINWMHRKSRCLSINVVGPAGVTQAKLDKVNAIESRGADAFNDYYNFVINKIKNEKFKKDNPLLVPIRNDDENAKEKIAAKLEALKANHEEKKQANALLRKGDIEGVKALLGNDAYEKCCYKGKFEGFYLVNSNAEIKRLEGRLKLLDKIKEVGNLEIIVNENLKFIQCSDTNRIYIEFEGKPSDEARNILKKNGFKWTPSRNHWGRILTPNACYVTKNRVIPLLKEALS